MYRLQWTRVRQNARHCCMRVTRSWCGRHNIFVRLFVDDKQTNARNTTPTHTQLAVHWFFKNCWTDESGVGLYIAQNWLPITAFLRQLYICTQALVLHCFLSSLLIFSYYSSPTDSFHFTEIDLFIMFRFFATRYIYSGEIKIWKWRTGLSCADVRLINLSAVHWLSALQWLFSDGGPILHCGKAYSRPTSQRTNCMLHCQYF